LADQRKAALDVAIRKIEKNFGKGSIMRMGDATDMKVASVSSGSLAMKFMVLKVLVRLL